MPVLLSVSVFAPNPTVELNVCDEPVNATDAPTFTGPVYVCVPPVVTAALMFIFVAAPPASP